MLLSMLFHMQYRLFWTHSQDLLLLKSFGNAMRWLGKRTTVSQLGRQRSCSPDCIDYGHLDSKLGCSKGYLASKQFLRQRIALEKCLF